MDNYFQQCPPMMSDGRLFTDYRSSQVREELFRYDNCVTSENEARTLRIDNGSKILDRDWNYDRMTKSCFPAKVCFHKNPKTQVTNVYNNAELLAYNGDLPAPRCDIDCGDFRATSTPESRTPRPGCLTEAQQAYRGYPADRDPVYFPKNTIMPENSYVWR